MNITVNRAVIERALEVLERPTYDDFLEWASALKDVRDSLRTALKQPEQRWTPENLAAMRRLQEKQYQRDAMRQKVQQEPVLWKDKHGKTLMSLDASQPIQELVCSTALEQPEQEPVAWMLGDKFYKVKQCRLFCKNPGEEIPGQIPLYTTPPQRKPLTDEEIADLWNETVKYAPSEVRIKDFARAIETAHNIKE